MQYVLSYKSKESMNVLINKLTLEGFSIRMKDYPSVGFCIDLNQRVVFPLTPTYMACYSSNKKGRPLNEEEFLEYYDSLMIDRDYELYIHLIEEKRKKIFVK